MGTRLFIFLGVTALLAQVAQGQAGEIAVQGSNSTGGDAFTIVGRVGSATDFSVTGAFDDVAELVAADGTVLFSRTIRQCWNGDIGPLVVRNRVKLPDGNSRVFLRVNNTLPSARGASVRVRRGYFLFDQDPIVLR